MFIYMGRRDLGSRYRLLPSASRALVHWRQMPLLIKVAVYTLLGLTLLNTGILKISRTTSPSVKSPTLAYMPGNLLQILSTNTLCQEYGSTGTCLAHLSDQEVYLYYEYIAGRKIIVRTTIRANEYSVGALILAWGTPSGFDRYGKGIVISWGTRSANLETSSFQPSSQVEFVTYDLEPYKRSPWRGFDYH